jgi:hypothetical protein
MENRQEVGAHVVYVDERGESHNALVTVWWGPHCCNLLYVSGDPQRSDGYGRQIERRSSTVDNTLQPAHGNYWHWPNDER